MFKKTQLGATPAAEIMLGAKVRDIITGFSGIVTSRIEYINGCTQFCVVPPQKKDGAFPEGQWVDYQRLKVIAGGVTPKSADVGGDMGDAPPIAYRG